MRIEADWLHDPAVQVVMTVLKDGGHGAWFVGGCVRNAVLGAGASDVDITTDALPGRVMALAEDARLRAVPTGVAHGTVTIVADSRPFEITTLRRDVETHGRHATVAFGTSLAEDAARRDFTMNALYATVEGEVLDPLGEGLADLCARRLRFIGDPRARIREDYLRILRFFRFHAWYADPEGGIDAEGLAACAEGVDGLDRLSRERVGAEMRKLLAAPDPAPAVGAMSASGVLLRVLPGAGVQTLAVLVHVETAAGLEPDWLCRLAALGGADAAGALRLSRAEERRLERLRDAMERGWGPEESGYRLGEADASCALALRAALAGREIEPGVLDRMRQGAARVFPLRAADLPGHIAGKAIGETLIHLESLWIADGFAKDRAGLLELLRKDHGTKPPRQS